MADVEEIEEVETIIETTETTETKETSEAVAEATVVIEEEAVVADTRKKTTASPQVTESLKGKYTIQTH